MASTYMPWRNVVRKSVSLLIVAVDGGGVVSDKVGANDPLSLSQAPRHEPFRKCAVKKNAFPRLSTYGRQANLWARSALWSAPHGVNQCSSAPSFLHPMFRLSALVLLSSYLSPRPHRQPAP
ncbi:hypothetical protein L1887_58251 [Cichorium endivia]|nr:hypothetical protein L1887_58251 [Cichorium endivia]